MFFRLLLLLTLVPLVELVILLRLADGLGWQSTLALIVLTGVVGAFLARREGLKAFMRIQDEAARGIPPADALLNGALVLAAGLLLVTPGVLTDLCGFAVLIAPLRRRLVRQIRESIKKRIVMVHPGGVDPFVDVEAAGRDAESTPHSAKDGPRLFVLGESTPDDKEGSV